MKEAAAWPNPTAYPSLNRLIEEWFASVQAIFAAHLLAVYLDGSLTSGDFDQDSDIDFVVVTAGEIAPEVFASLQSLHTHLAEKDPLWGINFEGSYLPAYALRRYDPVRCRYPNMERGSEERLKLIAHDETWDVHRSVLRERGIVMFGPPARSLIDPVSADQLRGVMAALLSGWAAGILANPEKMRSRGYQSYVVLSLCRILYTLQSGAIASKPAALAWARENLEPRWHGLIARAWEGRSQPGLAAVQNDLDETLDLIRYTIEYSRQSPNLYPPALRPYGWSKRQRRGE